MKTHTNNLSLLPVLIAGLGLILAGQVTAQSFTTIHSFDDNDGNNPQAGLVLLGNTFYGATDSGGSWGHGTVFAVNVDGTGFTNLYSFTGGSDGRNPDGTLILSGSTVYGTAYYGGSADNGVVFAVNTYGTGFTDLYSFSASSGSNFANSDGAYPEAGLVISGNTLYGTTEHGGGSGYGVVFKVSTDGAGFTNLYSFTNGSDGSVPECLLLSGNILYGTTLGLSGNGTVFAVNTDGKGFTILHSFTATNFSFPPGGPGPAPGYTNSDGVGPTGLTLSSNILYGTAYLGGTNGNGTVFALNTDGTGFTTLHSFAATSGSNLTNGEGTHPIAFTGLVLSGNTLYGTANYGGSAGNGTVFAVNTNGTGFTNLHSFTAESSDINSDGANPYAGLVIFHNMLYGTAKRGGTNGNGTVFSLSLGSVSPPLAVTTTSLANGTNFIAYNQLLNANGGQTPYSWSLISGSLPSGLTLATNGLISGTPTTNGTFNFTVKVTDTLSATASQTLTLLVGSQVTVRTLTTLYNFTAVMNSTNSDGANPFAGLILSGNTLYGTTEGGGSTGNGTVFKVNIDGSGFTNLHSFTGNDGAYPQGGLVLSGNTLYGTTEYGGIGFQVGFGTVFKVNTDGSDFTPLHIFNIDDGANPIGGLILSGNTLYGTTVEGESAGYGTVFAVNTDGSGFTNLHAFNYPIASDGAEPFAGLILSGYTLYGTTWQGGSSDEGTVFAINTNGTGFTNLHSFTALINNTNSGGAEPTAGLILSGNTLYGTTERGGSSTNGTVFKVNIDGTGFTTLYAFTGGSDGANPLAGLALSGNTLYGTIPGEVSSANSTVFAINTDGSSFTILYRFIGGTDGAHPNGELILSGNTLYGTTLTGGSGGSGTVFSLTLPPPQLTIIRSGANVVLTWPTKATGFTLQSTTNLVSPVWSTNSPAPVVINGQNTVTNLISGTQQFFRLSQ
jgi:uncharacterized repeat protein (TIGR03803 family)